MAEQDTNEPSDEYYECDSFGRPIWHYYRADPSVGDPAGLETTCYYYDVSGSLTREFGPPPTIPCPNCRGTGRVMLLVSSRICEKCSGTGKGP